MKREILPPDFRTAGLSTCFSSCRRYRYCLQRVVSDRGAGTVTFVMLNPATADEQQDDPTIRRCLGFARDWGFRKLYVVNLSPFRAPNPKLLQAEGDEPLDIQEINTQYVRQAVHVADLVVAAWGVYGDMYGRDRRVLQLMTEAGCRVFCLGTTKAGHPRHPLYVARRTLPNRFGRGL